MKNFKMLLGAAAAVLSMQQTVMGMDSIKGIVKDAINKVYGERDIISALNIGTGILNGRLREFRMILTQLLRGSKGTEMSDNKGNTLRIVSAILQNSGIQTDQEKAQHILDVQNAVKDIQEQLDRARLVERGLRETTLTSENYGTLREKAKSVTENIEDHWVDFASKVYVALGDFKDVSGKDKERYLQILAQETKGVAEKGSVESCIKQIAQIANDIKVLMTEKLVNTVFEKLGAPLNVLEAKVNEEIGKLEWRYGLNLSDFQAQIENAKGWCENVKHLKERVKTIEKIIGPKILLVQSEKNIVEAVISDIASKLERAISQAEGQLQQVESRTDTVNTVEEPIE